MLTVCSEAAGRPSRTPTHYAATAVCVTHTASSATDHEAVFRPWILSIHTPGANVGKGTRISLLVLGCHSQSQKLLP